VAPIAAMDALFVACAHIQPQRSLALLQQKDEDSRSRWYSPVPEQRRRSGSRKHNGRKDKSALPDATNGNSGSV
jgi:hypothetical protein